MSRLIKANFARLFKSTLFRICMLFSGGLGVFLDIMRYIDIQNNLSHYENLGAEFKSADGFAFSGALYVVFAVAAFVGIFVGTEYSDGTVRNKLMVGHKRWEIYISNFITCAAADIIMLLTFILVTLGLGQLILGKASLTLTEIFVYTLSQCATIISFTAILVLFSMLIQSKSAGSVTALILTVIMFMAALHISSKLEEPEYYNDYQATSTNAETGEMSIEPITIKNPRYISGTKRKIYVFANKALPFNQFYQIACNNDKNIGIMAIYSIIIVILSNGAGMVIFRKKDLK